MVGIANCVTCRLARISLYQIKLERIAQTGWWRKDLIRIEPLQCRESVSGDPRRCGHGWNSGDACIELILFTIPLLSGPERGVSPFFFELKEGINKRVKCDRNLPSQAHSTPTKRKSCSTSC